MRERIREKREEKYILRERRGEGKRRYRYLREREIEIERERERQTETERQRQRKSIETGMSSPKSDTGLLFSPDLGRRMESGSRLCP